MYCSKEKWNELTKPLKSIYSIIQEFAVRMKN